MGQGSSQINLNEPFEPVKHGCQYIQYMKQFQETEMENNTIEQPFLEKIINLHREIISNHHPYPIEKLYDLNHLDKRFHKIVMSGMYGNNFTTILKGLKQKRYRDWFIGSKKKRQFCLKEPRCFQECQSLHRSGIQVYTQNEYATLVRKSKLFKDCIKQT